MPQQLPRHAFSYEECDSGCFVGGWLERLSGRHHTSSELTSTVERVPSITTMPLSVTK
jgi:hypothetical protein